MKRYGLVGFPLGHSFSAGYFARKFETLGLTGCCSYENFPVENIDELRVVLPEGVEGFNITIPHKRNILPLLADIDPEAQAVGAVNCVRVRADGSFKGYNTDVYGFEVSLRRMLEAGDAPLQKGSLRALVLGTGGAAQAVHYVLRKLGIDYLEVSRTAAGERRLSYDQLTPGVMERHRLIVNTTPLGMYPNLSTRAELPYDCIGEGYYLYDLIYNPAETAFLREGRVRGAWVKSGLEMLVLQAERSWEIWNGEK
ncbi:MAG TPA: shikimate dehydrogenase [Candidatus Rikenella faecigallinarum]|uniref:Shikimate dehydrogenase n=1 Tax=Candidatus Rikenella faecigallinarum TaxID=2838745 RepID=A0A9D1TX32_9BACT|nr:shikimate dehydrogenase [Candidatus Rikenella faecigallinarum]